MKILVAAGGTGGHLFPMLAVVEQMQELYSCSNDSSDRTIDFYFFGRADKIEGKIVPALGYQLHTTKLTGLASSLSLQTLKIPFQLSKSILQLVKLIRTKKIDAVLCAGAYLSVPAGIAGKICGKKIFLMESNVNPGKAIRILSNFATLIYTSFDSTANYFNDEINKKIKNFGNPVRKNIIQNTNVDMAFERFNLEKKRRLVLIFGGSLGAKSINDAVLKHLDNFSKADYNILWQTGNNFKLAVELPSNIMRVEFIEDMAAAYSVADLVVARSGATTIAELCIVGKPAVLVPLPSASNNEQYLNAKYLADNNAGIIIKNEDIGNDLYSAVNDLMQNKQQLLGMSATLKSLAKPNASIKIATDILEEIIINTTK